MVSCIESTKCYKVFCNAYTIRTPRIVRGRKLENLCCLPVGIVKVFLHCVAACGHCKGVPALCCCLWALQRCSYIVLLPVGIVKLFLCCAAACGHCKAVPVLCCKGVLILQFHVLTSLVD